MSRRGQSGGNGLGAAYLAATYSWTWADATARQAQTVTAADVGKRGYQTDIALSYTLFAATGGPSAGGVWSENPCGRSLPQHGVMALANTSGTFPLASTATLTGGVIANVNNSGADTRVKALPAFEFRASGAAATNTGFYSGTLAALVGQGFRYRGLCRQMVTTANHQWSFGLIAAVNNTNHDPNADVNVLAIGAASADTQVQVYHNDGSGTANKGSINGGSGFPAKTANEGWMLQVYANGAGSVCMQVTNLLTLVQQSFTYSSDLPAATTPLLWFFYTSNGADAVQTTLAPSQAMASPVFVY